MPNKIEIFEDDESYAFVVMTQTIQPAVQNFADVADLAIAEVRIKKANAVINDFSKNAEGSISGKKMMPGIEGFTQESFRGVKRFSSLLPSEIINSTFESPIGTLVSTEAFNGDWYWARSSNETTPSIDELGDTIEQYQAFYEEGLNQQFSGFIDGVFKKDQRVRLENFSSN